MQPQRARKLRRPQRMALANQAEREQQPVLRGGEAAAAQRRALVTLVEVGAAQEQVAGVGRELVGVEAEGAVEVEIPHSG